MNPLPMPAFTRALVLLAAAVVPARAGDLAEISAPSTGGWEFSLSAGPAYRALGHVETRSGYRSGGLALPSFVGTDERVVPPVGDPGSPAEREYNNGFVRQDAGTATDGSTWNWGYDSASQVQGDELVYQATGFQSIYGDSRSAPATGPTRRQDLEGVAPHLQFDARSPHRLGPFRIGFTAGLDFMKTDRSVSFSNFTASQQRDDYRLDYEDRYDLAGVIPPLAPYQGSFAGPGPVISNFPASRTVTPVLLQTETAGFANQVSSSFELDAWSMAFGPTLGLTHGPLDFAVSAGLTFNIYSWEASQDESLNVSTAGGTATFASWSERNQGVKFRPGLYLQGEAGWSFTERLGVSGFVRLDVAKGFNAGAGPTSYEVDAHGVTGGLMLRLALP